MWVKRLVGDGEWDVCSLGSMEAGELYTVGEGRPQRGEISHMSRWHKGLAQFGSELACRPESEEECTRKRAISG